VFQSTAFYRIFSGGGLYLFDELDGSMRGAVLAFNAALSNGYCDFAGKGRVYRHKDCFILGAGNTPLDGTGSEDGYFRIQHDASFRDRFAFMPWPIDEALEASFVPSEYRFWYEKVLTMRRNCVEHGSPDAPSPRAVYWGVARLEQGVSIARCEEALLKRHLPDEVWQKLRP
jgi:hypothetical protein